MANRTVTVYNTLGQNKTLVETNADTWGALQVDLREKGVNFSDMKAIVAETQNTLESPEALLPKQITVKGVVTDNFTLFLTPVKVKSGSGLTYKEAKAEIKELREKYEDAIKHFGDYTHDSTDTLNRKLASWDKKKGTKKSIGTTTSTKTVSKSSTDIGKTGSIESGTSEGPSLLNKAEAAYGLLGDIIAELKTGTPQNSFPIEPSATAIKIVEQEEEEDTEELDEQFESIKRNFRGI